MCREGEMRSSHWFCFGLRRRREGCEQVVLIESRLLWDKTCVDNNNAIE